GRGEIVRARLGVRIAEQAVTRESADGAGAQTRQELRVVAAVVDEQHEAPRERGREARDPALSGRAHLPPPTDGQLLRHAVAKIRAWRAKRLSEPAVLLFDEDLADAIAR